MTETPVDFLFILMAEITLLTSSLRVSPSLFQVLEMTENAELHDPLSPALPHSLMERIKEPQQSAKRVGFAALQQQQHSADTQKG